MNLKQEFTQNMELRVLLLALYKKDKNESFKDIILTLEANKLFSLKTGKRFLKILKELHYINDNGLTIVGVEKAKEIELEFTI